MVPSEKISACVAGLGGFLGASIEKLFPCSMQVSGARIAQRSRRIVPYLPSHQCFANTPTSLPWQQLCRRRAGGGTRQIHNYHRSRHNDEDEAIPFEDDLPKVKEEAPSPVAYHQQRSTTITNYERRAFQRLFADLIVNPPSSTTTPPAADASDLDSTGSPARAKTRPNDRFTELTALLETNLKSAKQGADVEELKEQGFADTLPEANSSSLDTSVNTELQTEAQVEEEIVDPLQEAREKECKRIEELMLAAKTDMELWTVLENELFSVMRKLDLDKDIMEAQRTQGKRVKGKKQSKKHKKREEATGGADSLSMEQQTKDMAMELAIVGPNYPSLLVVAMRQFRQEFPGSPLALAVLPMVKSLGRGSYALGANTVLYNEAIAVCWITYGDFNAINKLLEEMEISAIDFEANTLDLLEAILLESKQAVAGSYGNGVAALWRIDRFKRGLVQLEKWRYDIQARLEADRRHYLVSEM